MSFSFLSMIIYGRMLGRQGKAHPKWSSSTEVAQLSPCSSSSCPNPQQQPKDFYSISHKMSFLVLSSNYLLTLTEEMPIGHGSSFWLAWPQRQRRALPKVTLNLIPGEKQNVKCSVVHILSCFALLIQHCRLQITFHLINVKYRTPHRLTGLLFYSNSLVWFSQRVKQWGEERSR